MQIDGNGTAFRINPYSRTALPGEKPQGYETDGAVPVGLKPETTEEQKKLPTTSGSKTAADQKTDPQKEAQIQRQIQELLQIQNKVIVHEQAHMSAGGELAGGASYSYTTGPDGKRYISGGEVSISIPAVKEPEEKVRVMAKVRTAALAPADPSPQDMRVAASASAKESEARMELARKRVESAYGGSSGQTEQKKSDALGSQKKGSQPASSKNFEKAVVGSQLDISL